MRYTIKDFVGACIVGAGAITGFNYLHSNRIPENPPIKILYEKINDDEKSDLVVGLEDGTCEVLLKRPDGVFRDLDYLRQNDLGRLETQHTQEKAKAWTSYDKTKKDLE